MGICGSSLTEEERRQKEMDKKINNDLRAAQNAELEIIKLLLLGAGESGKSTIFKQMKLLYGTEKDFSDQTRRNMIGVIHGNIIDAMQTLISNSHIHGTTGEEKAQEPDPTPDLTGWDDAVQFQEFSDVLDEKGAELVNKLWKDKRIQNTYHNRSKFQLPDTASYYFDKVDEIVSEAYKPSNDDILRSRVRTSGIVEENYEIDNVKFSMYDVGGQRNERKKWIHCFEDVTAVVFVAALSAYDQVLYEDENQNRMTEAIQLFGQICNEQWFEKSAIILFLNKKDLFEEKIARVNPRDCVAPNGERPWADFEGELGDYDAGCNYFEGKFKDQNLSPDHHITAHMTCATDSDNVKVVFETCKSVILEENLSSAGFM
jgi:GTPase SAR1 family protein